MQTKTYGMKEGFLIGGGLICIGLILQLCIGPVIWNAFRWPINGVLSCPYRRSLPAKEEDARSAIHW